MWKTPCRSGRQIARLNTLIHAHDLEVRKEAVIKAMQELQHSMNNVQGPAHMEV